MVGNSGWRCRLPKWGRRGGAGAGGYWREWPPLSASQGWVGSGFGWGQGGGDNGARSIPGLALHAPVLWTNWGRQGALVQGAPAARSVSGLGAAGVPGRGGLRAQAAGRARGPGSGASAEGFARAGAGRGLAVSVAGNVARAKGWG